jgi:hypothetical protein
MPNLVRLTKTVCDKFTPHNVMPGATRMKRGTASIVYMSCFLATPLLAQTATIGGGVCNSGSLDGIYSVSITGRQVTKTAMASGIFTNVFQASGSATFDGLSKVTIALTADTNQAVATSLAWSGNYSVQANCAGVMNITTGGSATLNLALYDGGVDFLVSGSDASYTYSGGGNTQPAGCSASTFSGVYTLTGTGFALTASAVSGAENGTGLLQFDGLSGVTVNITMSTIGAPSSILTLTGSYTVSAGCLGSATLTDASANTYVMSFSIYNTHVSTTAFYAMLAQSSKFLIAGSGHAIFGQPTAKVTGRRSGNRLAMDIIAKPLSGSGDRGKRA